MQRYEVTVEGYHSPLTQEEISQHFYAGRLCRFDACRVAGKAAWRTIDEIFPLLKYDATLESRDTWQPPRHSQSLAPYVIGGVIVLCGLTWFLAQRAEPPAFRSAPLPVVERYFAHDSNPPPANPSLTQQGVANQPFHQEPTQFAPTPKQAVLAAERERLARDQQAREESQRAQAASADRLRQANGEEARARERAAGHDQIIPLDHTIMMNVGGTPVSVKIHDNDVTSFDVWINGSRTRNVRKQKGISHSGTDETLIYPAGNASLYYVWEISGELNHCILRMRE